MFKPFISEICQEDIDDSKRARLCMLGMVI